MAQPRRLDVAIIGAGAAGLATARELRRAGHGVTIFEQAPPTDGVGGVWVYTDATEEEDDEEEEDGQKKKGATPPRPVHSSMYAGLRTNLPRHLMSFSDFPFDARAMGGGGSSSSTASTDGRTYPGHAEVRAYLAAFAAAHGLGAFVRHGEAVVTAEPVSTDEDASAGRPPLPWPRWRVVTEGNNSAGEVFDALAVCNGHFAVPRVPPSLGIHQSWPGVALHSHNYRSPTAGRLGAALARAGGTAVVAILGTGPSGEDLARELSPHAGVVLLCGARWDAGRRVPAGPAGNVRAAPWVTGVAADGTPTFAPGDDGGDGPPPPSPLPRLDALVLATGYCYAFPFLHPSIAAAVDNEVTPHLADHMWPPAYAPGLALLGLPFKVVPFPLHESQARRLATALAGTAPLAADLEERARRQAADRRAAGIPPRHAHCLSGARQWDYMNGLVAESGGGGAGNAPPCSDGGGGGGGGDGCGTATTTTTASPFMPPWRAALYDAASAARKADPDGYRDDAGSGVFVGEAAEAARAWVEGWKKSVR